MSDDVAAVTRRHLLQLGLVGGAGAAVAVASAGKASYVAPAVHAMRLSAATAESSSVPAPVQRGASFNNPGNGAGAQKTTAPGNSPQTNPGNGKGPDGVRGTHDNGETTTTKKK
jgi:hypothetical protein